MISFMSPALRGGNKWHIVLSLTQVLQFFPKGQIKSNMAHCRLASIHKFLPVLNVLKWKHCREVPIGPESVQKFAVQF